MDAMGAMKYGGGLSIEDRLARLEQRPYGDRLACRLYKTSPQTLTTGGTNYQLTFDGELGDVRGMHSTVSNTERITVPESGIYLVTASAGFGTSAAAYYYQLKVQHFDVAGAEYAVTAGYFESRRPSVALATYETANTMCAVSAAAGDYFIATATSDLSGLTVYGGGIAFTSFSVVKIA